MNVVFSRAVVNSYVCSLNGILFFDEISLEITGDSVGMMWEQHKNCKVS